MPDRAPQENIESEDLGLSPEDRTSLLRYLEQTDLLPDFSSSDSEDRLSGRLSLTVNRDESDQQLASTALNKPAVHLPRINPFDYGPCGCEDAGTESPPATKQSRPWPNTVGISSTLLSNLLRHLEGEDISSSLELRAGYSTTPPSPSVYESIIGGRDAVPRESPPYSQSSLHSASCQRVEPSSLTPEESYEQIVQTFLLDISFEDSTEPEQTSPDDIALVIPQSNAESHCSDSVTSTNCLGPGLHASSTPISTAAFPLLASGPAPPRAYQARPRLVERSLFEPGEQKPSAGYRKMDPRGSRFLDPSSAMAAITRHKAEAIKLAREQGTAVKEMCRRAKTQVPPYEFEELIGKGAYGRVYKGREIPSGRLVALKVLDIDSLDYKSLRDFRDESIKDFIHETKVMKQVKDSGAKNINELIEAVSIHSQLWLVCEYCPGGSVRTLMRATNDKLEEKFIIPIARELAVGLRAIHDAGIIHRDVKAANILVHEEGRLEICDFGVAGILQTQRDKRSTWIGTPHWMPPEMFATRGAAHQYGSEIDVWAFGCTLFEFATGNPPNSGLRERMQIGRQLNRNAPKLESDKYSQGLKDLIAFALDSNPATRPTMADILEHPYIAQTEEEYPTSSVSELVRNYYQWSQRGGQRISLFHPGGAAAAELPGTEESDDDWNFSTTDGFERRFSVIDLDQIAASLAEMEEAISPTTPTLDGEFPEDGMDSDLDPEQKANFDERVRRGAAAMEGLFDEEKPSYKYETKNDFIPIQPSPAPSDLPLRTDTDRSSVMSTLIDIDIGSFDSSHYAAGVPAAQPFQLADADTIRANRSSLRLNRNSNENSSQSSGSGTEGSESQDEEFQPPSGPRPPTMDWKFPIFVPPEEEEVTATPAEEPPTPEPIAKEPVGDEKRATMAWTFPVMSSAAHEGPVGGQSIDRHDTVKAPLPGHQRQTTDEPGDSRPSTSASNKSTISDSDYDPFRFDRPTTPQGHSPQAGNSFDSDVTTATESSVDGDYEHGGILDGPGPDEEDAPDLVEPPDDIHPLPTALPILEDTTSTPVSELGSPVFEDLHTARRSDHLSGMTAKVPHAEAIPFPALIPPRAESLMEGVDDATVTTELERLLDSFMDALSATSEALGRVGAGQSQSENEVQEVVERV